MTDGIPAVAAAGTPDLSAPGAVEMYTMIQQRYGRLQESGWYAVTSLDRSKENLAWLLEDSRWKQCGFDRIADFVGSLDLSKIRFDAKERRALVQKINRIAAEEAAEAQRLAEEARRREEEEERAAALEREAKAKGMSQRAIAGAVGVDEKTVRNDLKSAEQSAPETAENGGSSDGTNPPNFETAQDQGVADGAGIQNRGPAPEPADKSAEQSAPETAPPPRYSTIVIDPPWPMQKIERDVRPAQTQMPYPTMSEAELQALELPAADDCHVWCWTTQKFLPMALRLLPIWGVKYVCTFVWHKPGGIQPHGLPQYNCEFALYGRIGAPKFIDRKAFPVCFDAPRGGHSEKPAEFYDTVRRVTDGPRLDMFNRRSIDGFEGWGNESG